MTPILVIIGFVIALRLIAGWILPDDPEPAAPTALPPPPRRAARRRAPPKIPAPTAAAEDDEGPAVHPVHAARPVSVTRRVSPFAFRGRADARRAVVMREVLGPPLSLRR